MSGTSNCLPYPPGGVYGLMARTEKKTLQLSTLDWIVHEDILVSIPASHSDFNWPLLHHTAALLMVLTTKLSAIACVLIAADSYVNEFNQPCLSTWFIVRLCGDFHLLSKHTSPTSFDCRQVVAIWSAYLQYVQ